MTYQRFLLALPLAAALLGQPAHVLTQGRQSTLIVSVVDAKGAPVADLGPGDFIIREDNAAREVLTVGPATEPMQIAVLVDTSEAAGEQIQDIRRALPGFLDEVTAPMPSGRKNEVAILALAERPTILADFTTDRATLDKAIGLIWNHDRVGMYLLDATMEVSRGFKRRGATRPVIVALASDGPELSARHYSQVLDPLKDIGATFHVISLGRSDRDVTSDSSINRNIVIEQGPKLNGGLHDRLLTGNALPAKLKQLGAVLTHQYRVTYGHPDSLIPPERITVSARRPELVARGVVVKNTESRR